MGSAARGFTALHCDQRVGVTACFVRTATAMAGEVLW